jgi:Uri superfamily endonuclease
MSSVGSRSGEDGWFVRSDAFPRRPGTYTLLIRVSRPVAVRVGRLGVHEFPAGVYAYTGSALGVTSVTLRTRIARHLAARKTVRWHVDHLLLAPVSRVVAVVFVEDPRRLECAVVQALDAVPGCRHVVRGFGASDCRSGCSSHLHYCGDVDLDTLVPRVAAGYRSSSRGCVGVVRIAP